MRIERNHSLGKAEAIRRIDRFLDELMTRQPPPGISISSPSKSWSENVMRFSFHAKKAFFGAAISGTVRAEDDSVVMDAEIPALITTFVPETQIRNVINQNLDTLLRA